MYVAARSTTAVDLSEGVQVLLDVFISDVIDQTVISSTLRFAAAMSASISLFSLRRFLGIRPLKTGERNLPLNSIPQRNVRFSFQDPRCPVEPNPPWHCLRLRLGGDLGNGGLPDD